MNFSIIEDHPWATAAVIGIGGLGLYLLFRGGGGSSGGNDGSVVYAAGGGQPSDTAVAANAATTNAQIAANVKVSEYSAQLAALELQRSGAVEIAKISAGVSNFSTAAALQASLAGTSAQLQYGLSAQDAAVEIARIQAGQQQQQLAAVGGTTSATAIRPYVPTAEPIYSAPITTVTQVQTPGAVVPGGTLLVSLPDYAACDPFDSACVARNATTNTNYNVAVDQAQRTNNYNQCVSNAANANSPEQYAAVMATCEAARVQ